MREIEKMRSEMLYRFDDAEVLNSVHYANDLCVKLSHQTLSSSDYRPTIEALIPNFPLSSAIAPPFFCDHGHGITIGEDTFINYDCIMLDGGNISIGKHCKIGPRCQFLTPQHPINYKERMKPVEVCHPIKIGNNCWLGSGVIVCPGVTIGDRSIVAAGSVVVHDIPADSMAAGNPAIVKKVLNE